jgi:hypothetical protein
MIDIIEEWFPIAEFEKHYPKQRDSYLIKVNGFVIIYKNTFDNKKESNLHEIFFSIEDALKK